MIKLYYAPRTRSVRILWLLEELGLPYELERGEFAPPSTTFFQQKTPLGKYPTIEDGDVVMGFTLAAAAVVELLDDRHQPLKDYLGRLMSRPAFLATMAAE